MRQKQRNLALVAILICLVVSGGQTAEAIDREMMVAVTNMLHPDASTDNLISLRPATALYAMRNEPTSNLNSLINFCFSAIVSEPLCPYKCLASLSFCKSCKISNLNFQFIVKPTVVHLVTTAMIATKTPTQVQMRTSQGSCIADPKPQYTTVSGKNVLRGLYQNEIELIQNKMTREAVFAMKKEITAKTGLASDTGSLFAYLYLDESNKLRMLMPQSEYKHTELDNIEPNGFGNAVQAASLGQISDGSVVARVEIAAKANSRSSFFYVPNDSTFFVGSVTNSGSSLLLRLSTFKVNGKLPSGALATSVGSWKVERNGAASSPSLAQLIAIFPPLKG